MKRFGLALAMVGLVSGVAQAQSLRSDSPLWTYQNEPDPGLFPTHFFDEDSFGCSIPLGLGIYRVTSAETDEDESFVRVANYGVIHCALIYGEAYDREDAGKAFEDHAWLIQLDKLRRADGNDDYLLALQIGVRAGSRYVLLRRHGPELSAALEELDWKCPANAERRTAQIDIWKQDACIIASKADLRRMARNAARRPPVATWTLLPHEEEEPSGDQDR
ncbi:hypothetical protein ACO2Q1_13450 [Brevundimonas sp. VNH65]|uniref:hypothetical protein n=1 Tax=Brevundimonas sp. VNH65 TaxID=3400917 RepID=UPI003C0F2DD1